MLTEQQFYYIYSDYCVLIQKLSDKLDFYKLKNPNADVTEQFNFIRKLIYLKDSFYKLYQLCLLLDGQQGKWSGEKQRLLQRIYELEKENESLKNNIL